MSIYRTPDQLNKEFSPYTGFKNLLINGDFSVWQRGTSFSGNVYSADRWLIDTSSGTVTRDIDAPDGFAYSLKCARTANAVIRQRIELAGAGIAGTFKVGQTFTLTLKVKDSIGANDIKLYAAFVDANGANPVAVVNNLTIGVSTTAWQEIKYTFTITSAPVGTNAALEVAPYVTGTTGNIFFAGIQLEKGEVPTPFEQRPYGVELALCQRYFQVVGGGGTLEMIAMAHITGPASALAPMFLATPMRSTPSISLSAASDWLINSPAAGYTVTGFSLYSFSGNNLCINFTSVTMTNPQYAHIEANNANARIYIDAEL